MTNDEIRRNDEIRMTKPANAPLSIFRHSGFGFLLSFVICHSSFVIQRLVQFRFMVPMHAKNESGLSMNRMLLPVWCRQSKLGSAAKMPASRWWHGALNLRGVIAAMAI